MSEAPTTPQLAILEWMERIGGAHKPLVWASCFPPDRRSCFRTLAALHRKGLIQCWATTDGPRRGVKHFTITPAGLRVLEGEG